MIAQGRATIQLIQAARVMLADSADWSETALLKLALALYRYRLRRSIAVLPPDWSTEILAASEAMQEVGWE